MQHSRDNRALRSNGGVCAAVVLFFLLLVPGGIFYGQTVPADRVFVEGEELVYNVRYGFIDLGQVRIKTSGQVTRSGRVAFQTFAHIDSYKKVPFVNLHAVFESFIDSGFFSHFFVGKSLDGDYWNFGRYRYDYEKNLAFLEAGSKDTLIEKRDTIILDGKTQDGLSLFFLARKELFSGRRLVIPAIVKEKKVFTHINFQNKREEVESDLLEYPVDAVGFEGTMEFTGIFGLTGDFEGWFSNDEARIPILAKMKVILGSVTIELMEWKRPGWKPPRAQG